MAQNYVTVELDLQAPATPTIAIEGGNMYATTDLVDVQIGTADTVTTGYEMKIWGAVDVGANLSIQATREASEWIAFVPNQPVQVRLSAGEGDKTLSVVLRDEVYNESGESSDTIKFDTTRPTVSVSPPDVPKISKQPLRNVVSFSFTADTPFVEYMVKVVNSIGATNDLGTVIPTTNGSVNTSGTTDVGTPFDTTTTPITVTINGSDLELAGGAGLKTIKVFVRDEAGFWSA
jgi:hypothetical protein